MIRKTLLILTALSINGAVASIRPMSKPDADGKCFYALTEREKREFDDACFYQPKGLNACLPETCRESEPPKASECRQ